MKFGLFLSMYYPDTNKPYHEMLDETVQLCQYAEELGYDAIFIPEHHFVNFITNPSSLSLAIHIANHTKKIRLVTAVVVMPWYHPLALAEELALVDHISNGRIELGVARGANKYEFDRLGVDIKDSREMMNESLDVLLKALQEEDIKHSGKFFSFPETTTMPRPLTKPHPPIWVGAQTPEGFRNAAERGFNVFTSPLYGSFSTESDFEYTLNHYKNSLLETGAKPKEFGVLRKIFVEKDRETAEKELDLLMEQWGVFMAFYETGGLDFRVDKADTLVEKGKVIPAKIDIALDQLAERYDDPILTDIDGARKKLKYYEEKGVTMFMANMQFGSDHEKVMNSLGRLGSLIPEFSSSKSLEGPVKA
ncbi:LLM class flavin-dependent oxidoreductase [Siminovitchia sediminis]|uniref:LLM class flavin-dependent oxidoreductase n=1 Tax=Siminovitchia sediminis TaxID=1274353 RepID=A0ABW4KL68_9BACI